MGSNDGTRSNDDDGMGSNDDGMDPMMMGMGSNDGTRSNDDGMGPMMGPDPMMMGWDL